ncbi:hypothetical protein AVEN_151637-1, partial [Araneus ventricosus]
INRTFDHRLLQYLGITDVTSDTRNMNKVIVLILIAMVASSAYACHPGACGRVRCHDDQLQCGQGEVIQPHAGWCGCCSKCVPIPEAR